MPVFHVSTVEHPGLYKKWLKGFYFLPFVLFPSVFALLLSLLYLPPLSFYFTLPHFWFLSFSEHNNNCCTKHTISKTNENHFKCWKYVYFKDSVIFFTSPHSISPLVSSIFPKKSMNYNCMVYLCFLKHLLLEIIQRKFIHFMYWEESDHNY